MVERAERAERAERELRIENGKWKMEANASKRVQRLLASYAEREHFRASEAWSITPPLS